ncbi:hypothetical protein P9112_004015 [Eukaryota sp. TZLM1-RC]
MLSTAEVSFIVSLVKEDPLLYLREIKQALYRHCGRKCSISTIHRTLISNGFSRKRCRSMIRKAKVTLILAFEKQLSINLGIVLTYQLVFVDEISFRKEHFTRLYGRSPKNEPVAAENGLINVDQISLAVAIDQNGYLFHHLQEGQFFRLEYISFLKDILRLGFLRTNTSSRSVLIVDGCRIHLSPFITAALNKMGIFYIVLPPYCPESNPIEAYFSVLRKNIRDASHQIKGKSSIEIIQTVLPQLKFDCTALFNHSGWIDYQLYESPYLSENMSEYILDH